MNNHLERFYFYEMCKNFKRVQKRRYLRSVAKNYYVEQRKFKCINLWNNIVTEIRTKNYVINTEMKNRAPYGPEMLLELLAWTHLSKSQDENDPSI